MGIVYPQKVAVSAAGDLYKHLLNLGYQVKYREKVEIPIEHLMPTSNASVLVECDFCGESFYRSYSSCSGATKVSCPKCKGAYISEIKVASLPLNKRKYHDENWLRHQYVDLNRSAPDIAKECGVTTQTIEAILIKYNIRKTLSYEEVKTVLTRDVLWDMHIVNGIGIYTIAKQYPNIGVDTIKKLMDEYDIPELSSSELRKMFWQRPEAREKMSEIRKELWRDEEYRDKVLPHLQDEEMIRQRAIQFSATYQGVSLDEWSGFVTSENARIRESAEYESWRCDVFKRDNYTCQCCGARSRAGQCVTLHAHHLDSFALHEDKRFDVDNGVTLCDKCHDPRNQGSFHNLYGTVNNTRGQYQEYIQLRNSQYQTMAVR